MKTLILVPILLLSLAYSQCDANADGDLDVLDVIIQVECILTECWEADTTDDCVDIDGNSYETIQIGDQLWMSENLKTTHYNNGDVIPNNLSGSEWTGTSSGATAVYDGNASNADIYGNLYNWYAVDDSRGICPEGYHVATDDEYKVLEMYLGMSESEANDTDWRGTNEGSKLAGNADMWNDGNLENNSEFGSSGFNGLPGGYRTANSGSYGDVGYYGYFWYSSEYGSTSAWSRCMGYYTSGVRRYSHYKHYGFSVRCLGD